MGCGPCLGFNSEGSDSKFAQLSGSEEGKEKRDLDKQSQEKEKEDDDDDDDDDADEKNPARVKGTRIDKEKGGSDEQCMGCLIRWEPPPPP